MDISPSFDLLWRIANVEAWHCHSEVIEPIHFWLACLKLVSLLMVTGNKDQLFDRYSDLRSQVDSILAYLEMDAETTQSLRQRERTRLLCGRPPRAFPAEGIPILHRSESSRRLFELTCRKALSRRLKTITPQLLLECLFDMQLATLTVNDGIR